MAETPERPTRNPAPLRFLLIYGALALGMLWMWQATFERLAYQAIPYSEFKQALEDARVKRVAVAETRIEGELLRENAEGGDASVLFRTARVEDPKLTEQLLAAQVEVVGVHPGFFAQLLWAWLLPIALIVGLWVLFSRRLGSSGPFARNSRPARTAASGSFAPGDPGKAQSTQDMG